MEDGKTHNMTGGTAAPHDPEKEFSPQMYAALDKAIREFKQMSSSVISVLLRAQEIFGYLPASVLDRIAQGLNMYGAELRGIVSFYPCFRTMPGGDHAPCYLSGSGKILEGMIPKTGKRINDAVYEFIAAREAERRAGSGGS